MNNCKKPDGTTCDKCKKNHHCSLHNETINSDLSPNAVPFRVQDVRAYGNTNCTAGHKKDLKVITGLCPLQMLNISY